MTFLLFFLSTFSAGNLSQWYGMKQIDHILPRPRYLYPKAHYGVSVHFFDSGLNQASHDVFFFSEIVFYGTKASSV